MAPSAARPVVGESPAQAGPVAVVPEPGRQALESSIHVVGRGFAGEPVPMSKVKLAAAASRFGAVVACQPATRSGSFTLAQSVPCWLVAEAEGFVALHAELHAGESSLRLHRAAALRLRFVDSQQRPLAGVRVTLGPIGSFAASTELASDSPRNLVLHQIAWEQQSTADGLVVWRGLPAGMTVCYTVEPDHVVRYVPAATAAAPGSGPIVLDRAMTDYQVEVAGARIFGRVPVAHGGEVEVKLCRFERLQPRGRTFLGATRIAVLKLCSSPDGRFLFESVPTGDWVVRAYWREGTKYRFAARYCAMPTPPRDIDLGQLRPMQGAGLRCRIRLRDLDTGVDLQAADICDGPLAISVTLDSGGQVESEADFAAWIHTMIRVAPRQEIELRGLAPGPCHLVVQHWQGRLHRGVALEPDPDGVRVDLAAGQLVELVVGVRRLRANTIVVDCGALASSSGAAVVVVLASADGQRHRIEGVARDGVAELPCEVPVGRYRVYASATDQGRCWASESGAGLAGGVTRITLLATAPVTLRLRRASGDPRAGSRAGIEIAYGFAGWVGNAYVTTATTDAAGLCTIVGVPAGRTLRLRSARPLTMEPVEVPKGVKVELVPRTAK